MTKLEMGAEVRIAGLIRSPDREGALAHLDLERGFVLVARGEMGRADVIDPTIWVREKLSLALAGPGEESDPPLRRLIGAIRSLHGELMSRPEGERPWVALLTLLLHGEEAVAVSAGDCSCFRFRSGLLSRLGRVEADVSPRPPRGALGSETQVRMDVVPLRPLPGDLYILSTRPLREGEVAVLARDLTLARSATDLLRFAVDGSSDRGCIAVRVLDPSEEDERMSGPAPVLALNDDPALRTEAGEDHQEELGDWSEALEIEPIHKGMATPESTGWSPPAWAAPAVAEVEPSVSETPIWSPPPVAAARSTADFSDAPLDAPWVEPPPPMTESPVAREVEVRTPDVEPRSETDDHAPFVLKGDERPWFEPLALWGGGALAIVALALLVKALLPGILGTPRQQAAQPPVAAVPAGLADIYSDPPGALVRVDGVALTGRTPLSDVSLDAGIHRIELDWGPYGVWRDTVDAVAGSRLTLHPAVYGAATFRSSDPSRVLDVYLDGAYAGTTPLTLDSMVVGRHLVRFGGPGLAASAQELELSRGSDVELIGNAGPSPASGSVTVRTAILGDAGFEAGKGDPYWVDGVARGVTPATISIAPGTHSVRVARRGFPPQVTVLEIKPDEERFVTAEFSSESGEPLRYTPPESFSLSSQTPVMLELPSTEWDPSMAIWLYSAAPGGSFQAKRMTRLEEGSRSFAALLPPEVLRNSGRQVRLYFKATGTGGRELYSEIYTIPLRP